jgi:hypothetical protein
LRNGRQNRRSRLDCGVTAESSQIDHHRFCCDTRHLDFLAEEIEALNIEIDPGSPRNSSGKSTPRCNPFWDSRKASAAILAELVEYGAVPIRRPPASWAGLCPGNHQRLKYARPGARIAAITGSAAFLTQCAWAASNKKNSRLQSFYFRPSSRCGGRRYRGSATAYSRHLPLSLARPTLPGIDRPPIFSLRKEQFSATEVTALCDGSGPPQGSNLSRRLAHRERRTALPLSKRIIYHADTEKVSGPTFAERGI